MRVRAVVVAVVAVAAVVAPTLRRPPVDSFPLSTYPMFTQLRDRVTTLDLVLGVDADGRDVPLDPGLVGGTIEVIQAVATLRDAIAAGRTGPLCDEVAARVAGSDRASVVAVVVVTDRYDVVAARGRPAAPLDRLVHATCAVPW